MNPKEARKKLDRNSLLERRDKSRIFGNIDTPERKLTTSEIVPLVMDEMEFFDKLKNVFE